MEFEQTHINGVFIIKPRIFGDTRGYFIETYQQEAFEKNIGKVDFIQDNESKSSYGVLRGLHYQKNEYAQAKLVRVVRGKVIDVIVDIRKDSATFGQHLAIELNDNNKWQLYIPRGLAHGFVVLENDTIFCYKVDNIYNPEQEGGIIYNDSFLNIDWQIPKSDIKLSDKDSILPQFKDLY